MPLNSQLEISIKELVHELRENNNLLKQIMIAQTVLDTALTNLTTAVTAATAKLGTITTPSTPDTAVQALVDGVTAQTTALNNAVTPPATP